MSRIDDLTVSGNLIEAVLWAGFAVFFAAGALRGRGARRRLWLILSVAFVAFSLSDVIESRTGAWWRPPGLLVLKSACLCVFAYGIHESRTAARGAGFAAAGDRKRAEAGAEAARSIGGADTPIAGTKSAHGRDDDPDHDPEAKGRGPHNDQ